MVAPKTNKKILFTFARDAKSLGWNEATIASCQEVFSDFKSGNSVDFKAVLDNLGDEASLDAVHNWFIKVTQREFFARAPGQERWQQETGQWMKIHEASIRTLIERLGLIQEVKPEKQSYQMLAVFGSTYPEMVKRLQCMLSKLWMNNGFKLITFTY